MGLFNLTIAGCGYIFIGAWESLTIQPSNSDLNISLKSTPSSPINQIEPTSINDVNPSKNQSSLSNTTITYMAIAILALLFIANSFLSLFDAMNAQDRVGSALQLQVLPVAALFLLYSIFGLVSKVSSFKLPSVLLNLVVLFGFVEEFLLFYVQKKDTIGIENRYFDLMLVPISVCMVSTVLELKCSSSNARLGRAVGLILHGMWYVQMGISFYSSLIVEGCFLKEKSRGNYTIRCKGHPEYHRARGIATLQFNCHLALLVVVAMVLHSIIGKNNADHRDFMRYKPLGVDMQLMENNGQFSLDSEEDEIREEDVGRQKGSDEIREEDLARQKGSDEIREEDVARQKGSVVEMAVNGHGSQ